MTLNLQTSNILSDLQFSFTIYSFEICWLFCWFIRSVECFLFELNYSQLLQSVEAGQEIFRFFNILLGSLYLTRNYREPIIIVLLLEQSSVQAEYVWRTSGVAEMIQVFAKNKNLMKIKKLCSKSRKGLQDVVGDKFSPVGSLKNQKFQLEEPQKIFIVYRVKNCIVIYLFNIRQLRLASIDESRWHVKFDAKLYIRGYLVLKRELIGSNERAIYLLLFSATFFIVQVNYITILLYIYISISLYHYITISLYDYIIIQFRGTIKRIMNIIEEFHNYHPTTGELLFFYVDRTTIDFAEIWMTTLYSKAYCAELELPRLQNQQQRRFKSIEHLCDNFRGSFKRDHLKMPEIAEEFEAQFFTNQRHKFESENGLRAPVILKFQQCTQLFKYLQKLKK